MNAEKTDKRFYEKKWMALGEWARQRAPYLKKNPGAEGIKGLKWAESLKIKGKVLDIGCGAGRNSILFSQKGFEVLGIDFSSKAIRLANILKKEKKSSANFCSQSILEPRSNNEYFDLAMDYGCFHHLRKHQWRTYKKNLLKLLKPNGYYLLYCFSKESGITGNYTKGKDFSFRNHHYNHYFGIDELKKIFQKNFRMIKHETIKEKGRKLAFNFVLFKRL